MKRVFIALILIALLEKTSMGATTWHVDGSVSSSGNGQSWPTAFKTIQQGINRASEGDTVIVAEGTYYEHIELKGPNIVLTSTNPDSVSVREATIIDGEDADTVVRFSGQEDQTCVLTGFTIRKGYHESGAGGIDGRGARATIENNSIKYNDGLLGGGLSECHGTIQHNTIYANGARWGAGLYYCNGMIQENGVHENIATWGGGLYYCNGTIQHNTITDNWANSEGGGLFFCLGRIRMNDIGVNGAVLGAGLCKCDGEISANEIHTNYAAIGGGLYLCNGRIEGNLIRFNQAKGDDSEGGGLYGCDGAIVENRIEENGSDNFGGGLSHCDGLIEANTIMENTADNRGGGLYRCNGDIRSNLVVGNQALDGLGFGGGLTSCAGTIENNTIVANAAKGGGGLYACGAVVRNCVIWANTAVDYSPQIYLGSPPTFSCIQGWSEGGEGNTAVNPVFADPDGPDNDPNTYDDNNYRLRPYLQASVCIDKGNNESWMQFSTDLDGNPRVFYGLSSTTVDMGAYEYGSFPFKVVIVRKTPDGGTELIWRSRPGDTYVVWSRPMLYRPPDKPDVPWAERATLPGGAFFTSWTDSSMPYDSFFYRVELER